MKTCVLGALLSAALVIGVFGMVASASATQWLFGGESIKTARATNGEGTIDLHKVNGSLGSGTVKCDGGGSGTVGPGAAGEVTEVKNLSGTEKNLVTCERVSGFCFSPVMHALNLPRKGELVLEGGLTWAKGSGEFEFSCVVGNVACKGEGKAKFTKNTSAGAEFASEGEASGVATCSDGGTVTVTGNGTALGVTVS
ncbi:MAG: hypothetical protein ACTHM1_10280 [Solirubrobacteraceae bacterium]